MIRLKILLLTFAISASTILLSDKEPKISDLESLSGEVALLLRNSSQGFEKGKSVTIFFSVSEDTTMQSVRVAAPNEEVSKIVQDRLANLKLSGNWREGMIYELAVEYPKTTTVCARNW